MTLPKAHQYFHRFFPEKKFNDFIDPVLTLVCKQAKIDPEKFDVFLHEKHGEYESRNMSMEDLLKTEYGGEATAFIGELL
jgi:hypothetical protein